MILKLEDFASVGMVIGGLTALAPSRSKVFSKFYVLILCNNSKQKSYFKVFARYAAKAMIAGNITNFISGMYLSGFNFSNTLLNLTFNIDFKACIAGIYKEFILVFNYLYLYIYICM